MTLSFLYPFFLIGLIFLVIPIIIHLLQKKKIVKLQFSTTLFFKSSDLKKSKFRRLNQILQLLIRILIILLLVALFATPFNNNNPFNKLNSPKFDMYCWVDQSLSMDLDNGTGSLLHKSHHILATIDSSLQSDLLIYKDNNFNILDKNVTLKTNTNHSKFKNFLNDYNKQQSNNESAILIISDFQKCNIDLHTFINKNQDNMILAVNMQPDKISNMSIDSLRIIQSPEKKALVSLSKTGDINANKVELINKGMRRGHESVSFKEDNSTISIDISNEISNGSLQLTKKDQFKHDDIYYFSERELSKRNILIINNSDEFSTLEEAINTVIDTLNYSISTKSVKQVKAEDIENSQLIVLNSIVQASSSIYSLLRPGIFKNKFLLFSPSMKSGSKIFNREILKFLNSKITYEQIDTVELSPSIRFSSQYLWKDFKQSDLDEVKIRSTILNIPGSALLKSTNNRSLISIIQDNKESKWIISAIELEASESNNFATTGFYIPLIDRIIKELGFSENLSSQSFIAGKTFTTPIVDQRNEFEITGITNPEFKQILNSPYITLSNPGLYQIKNNKGKTSIFPVNTDIIEKDLSYYNLDHKPLSQNLKILNPSQITPFLKSIKNGNFEFFLIIALILLLIAELFLTIFLKGKRAVINSPI